MYVFVIVMNTCAFVDELMFFRNFVFLLTIIHVMCAWLLQLPILGHSSSVRLGVTMYRIGILLSVKGHYNIPLL